jgi:signal transduction histidine kinase
VNPHLPRLTIRLRLTLLYGVLFLLAGAALLGLTYVAFATTDLVVNVGSGGQVTVGFGAPFGAGAANTLAAPFGGSAADLPKLLQSVVDGQHAAEQQYYLRLSLVAIVVLAVASAAIGWLVAGRLLRRLRSMSAAARAISSTNLRLRIAPAGPDDELKDLGETFDDLLGRLERSFEAQRQFVANASHELRTPLTRQRALVQYALDDPAPTLGGWRAAFERILVAEGQQERLLEALFTLARGERGLERLEPVDLAEATSAALQSRRQDIEAAGLHLDSRLEHAPVRGDRQLLERLAVNLIDNATHYNVPDGTIEIATERRLGDAFLRVTNSGPSVPPADVSRLFEPFQRLPDRSARKEGSGLGLSIVRAVASAHGGDVRARAGDAGGLAVEVRIPAAAEATRSPE